MCVHTQSCLTLCDPMDCKPTRLLCPWDFPGKNTGVGCHFLLQEIFPTQGLNPGLLHCRQTLYHLSHQGGIVIKLCRTLVTPWTVARQAPRSMGFSRQKYWSGLLFPSPGDLPNPGIVPVFPQASALAGRFFTTEPPGKPQYYNS